MFAYFPFKGSNSPPGMQMHSMRASSGSMSMSQAGSTASTNSIGLASVDEVYTSWQPNYVHATTRLQACLDSGANDAQLKCVLKTFPGMLRCYRLQGWAIIMQAGETFEVCLSLDFLRLEIEHTAGFLGEFLCLRRRYGKIRCGFCISIWVEGECVVQGGDCRGVWHAARRGRAAAGGAAPGEAGGGADGRLLFHRPAPAAVARRPAPNGPRLLCPHQGAPPTPLETMHPLMPSRQPFLLKPFPFFLCSLAVDCLLLMIWWPCFGSTT